MRAVVFLGFVFFFPVDLSLKDHLSAQSSCVGTDVYDIVGSTHDVFVVLYYNHGVAQVAQLPEYVYQSECVAAV